MARGSPGSVILDFRFSYGPRFKGPFVPGQGLQRNWDPELNGEIRYPVTAGYVPESSGPIAEVAR